VVGERQEGELVARQVPGVVPDEPPRGGQQRHPAQNERQNAGPPRSRSRGRQSSKPMVCVRTSTPTCASASSLNPEPHRRQATTLGVVASDCASGTSLAFASKRDWRPTFSGVTQK